MQICKIKKEKNGKYMVRFSDEFIRILKKIRINKLTEYGKGRRYLIPSDVFMLVSEGNIIKEFFRKEVFSSKKISIEAYSISNIERAITSLILYWKSSIIQEDIRISIKKKRKIEKQRGE